MGKDNTQDDDHSTKQGSSFGSKANDVASSLYTSSQRLVPTNQGDITYEDSLMLFVKDLGPIGQMVAQRKLSWQIESNENILESTNPQRKRDCEDFVKTTSYRTLWDFASGTPPVLEIGNSIDLNIYGEESSSRHGCIESGTLAEKNNDFGLPMKEIPGFSTPARKRTGLIAKEKRDNIARGKEKLDRHITLTKDQDAVRRNESRKGSVKNKNKANYDQDFRLVILALEKPNRDNATGYKPRSKKNFLQLPCKLTCETKAVEKEGEISLPQANSPFKPVVSQFTFTLPFLKSRLSMMRAKEREGFSSNAGGSDDYQLKRPLFDQGGSLNCSLNINKTYVFGQSLSRQSSESLEASLALRL